LGDAGLLRPGPLRWLRTLAWLCVLTVLCILAFNIAADASLHLSALISGQPFIDRAHAPHAARLIAVIVGSIGMLAVYALGVRLAERRAPHELALINLAPDLAIGLAIGGALIGAIVGIMWAAHWVTITPTPITHVAESLKEAVQSGVIEETLLRLVIFRLLWRTTSVWPAFILTAVLFGALHLSNPDATPFSAACLIAGEGVGAGLYLLTGRVWVSIGMHAGWNFMQGWVFGAAVSGLEVFAGGPLQTHPVAGASDMLSGGGFGPESSAASLGVSLLASIVCMALAWRSGRLKARSDNAISAADKPPGPQPAQ
jgi:membrane protease YdiL (CAAX protease family)